MRDNDIHNKGSGMRKLIIKIIVGISLPIILVSCGDPTDPHQSTEVTFTGPLNTSVSSALSGGGMYYVVSTGNGGYRGTFTIGEGGDSVTGDIPNGDYTFYALGVSAFSSADSSLGFDPELVYCGGGSSVTLDGNPASVSIDLSQADCYQSQTYSGDYYHTGSPTALTVKFCGSASFSSISTYSDSCPTAYSGGNSSIKIGYLAQGSNFSGANSVSTSEGLFSSCQSITSGSVGVTLNLGAYGDATSDSSPLSLGILAYSGTSCSGTATQTFAFPKGLDTSSVESAGSAAIYSYSGAATLFLKQ